jgi:hypothetical protein
MAQDESHNQTPNESGPQVNIKTTQVDMGASVDYAAGATFSRFYANHTQASVTLFEIRLILNFVTGLNASGRLEAVEALILSLSPELASMLHGLLGKILENYVANFGPLRLSGASASTEEK